jgi:flavin-dependent dehydrogenase
VVLLGDAACQMFSPHGSGIGTGLVAARYLADALAHGGGPLTYQVRWQREQGGFLAAQDQFRRFTQRRSLDDLRRLIGEGFVDAEVVRAGLIQCWPAPSARALLRKVPALVRRGRLAGDVGRTLARMAAVRALYARYPRHERAVTRWAEGVARLAGET